MTHTRNTPASRIESLAPDLGALPARAARAWTERMAVSPLGGGQYVVETEADAPPTDDVIPDAGSAAQVVFATSQVTADCLETDTVLAVARQACIVIPSGCTFGVCGTCKIRKVSGQVHMVHSGGISDDDIEEGYILACCSKPIGAVAVEV